MFGNICSLRHLCGILIETVCKINVTLNIFLNPIPVPLINHYFSGNANLRTFKAGSDPYWHLKPRQQSSSEQHSEAPNRNIETQNAA